MSAVACFGRSHWVAAAWCLALGLGVCLVLCAGPVRGQSSPKAAAGAADNPPPARPGPRTLRFTRITVTDPMLRCDALTMLVPAGWELDGGLVWRENAFYPVTTSMRVHNPKGPEALHLYPQLLFIDGIRESTAQLLRFAGDFQADARAAAAFPEGGNYLGSEVRRRVAGPAEVVKQFVIPRSRKDLLQVKTKVLGVEDLPEVAKAEAAKHGNLPGLTVRSARVRLEYAAAGTQETIGEDFYCTVVEVRLPNNTVAWSAETRSYRAEKQRLDEVSRICRTIESSLRPDLKWFAQVTSIAEAMQDSIRRQIELAGQLSRYIARRNDEVTELVRRSYAERQKVQDRIDRQFSDYIRGVETYADPYDPQRAVAVPAGYERAFINPLGEVVLSNDPTVRAEGLHGDWRELSRPR